MLFENERISNYTVTQNLLVSGLIICNEALLAARTWSNWGWARPPARQRGVEKE
jgi:hypothetical protein